MMVRSDVLKTVHERTRTIRHKARRACADDENCGEVKQYSDSIDSM